MQLHELRSVVSQIIKETQVQVFSQSDIDTMYDQLYPYSQTDEETKNRHYFFNAYPQSPLPTVE